MSKKRTIAAFALAGVIATTSMFGNTFTAEAASDSQKTALHEARKGERALEKHITGKRLFAGVAGVVLSIDDTRMSVLGKNKVTYSITTADAHVYKKGDNQASSMSVIKSGDTVIVHGVRSGTEVTAKKIIVGSFSGRRFSKSVKSDN